MPAEKRKEQPTEQPLLEQRLLLDRLELCAGLRELRSLRCTTSMADQSSKDAGTVLCVAAQPPLTAQG